MTHPSEGATSRYRTIVADPPWHYEGFAALSTSTAPGNRYKPVGEPRYGLKPLPYPTLTVEEIAALPVGSMAEPDAHLYLWTTSRYLRDAYDVIGAWGFRYSQLLTWCKTPKGILAGGAYQPNAEYVLFARRGSLKPLRRLDTCWWHWPRVPKQHSKKPDAFLDIVEQVSPGPYVELFARRARFGWDYWGDQSHGTAEMPEAAA